MMKQARLLGLLSFLALTACAVPLNHPLRVADGWVAEASISFQGGAGREGSCDNFQGCKDSGAGDFHTFGINLFQLSGGFGKVIDGWIGLMGGLYFPAWENLKEGDWYNTFGAWSFFTAQNDYLSIGIGPEIGGTGWALLAGGEIQPGGSHRWWPALGVYGRIFWPFRYTHEEYDNRTRTWELGVRLRVGMFFAQYTYYTQVNGVMYWTIYETAAYAQGAHIFCFGAIMSAEAFGLLPR